MLHRHQEEGTVAVSQPAHAWVSGELARAWGNDAFGAFTPHEDVCKAAALHDIGFLNWERLPTLNQGSGLPHSFLDMPTAVHLELWSKGIRQMQRFGRYATLLVSMHFTHLRGKHRGSDPSTARLEERFLREQEALQRTLLTSLRNDFYYEPFSGDATIARNRELVSYWDWLSLMLCIGVRDKRAVTDVPAARGRIGITLAAEGGDPSRVTVFPWPFRQNAVSLTVEGRRLLKTFSNQTAMRRAFRGASPVTLRIDLSPGEAPSSSENLDA